MYFTLRIYFCIHSPSFQIISQSLNSSNALLTPQKLSRLLLFISTTFVHGLKAFSKFSGEGMYQNMETSTYLSKIGNLKIILCIFNLCSVYDWTLCGHVCLEKVWFGSHSRYWPTVSLKYVCMYVIFSCWSFHLSAQLCQPFYGSYVSSSKERKWQFSLNEWKINLYFKDTLGFGENVHNIQVLKGNPETIN